MTLVILRLLVTLVILRLLVAFVILRLLVALVILRLLVTLVTIGHLFVRLMRSAVGVRIRGVVVVAGCALAHGGTPFAMNSRMDV